MPTLSLQVWDIKESGRNNTHSKQIARLSWEDSTWKTWSEHSSVKRKSNNKEAIYAQMTITHFIEDLHKRYRMRGRTSAVDKKAVWLAGSRFWSKIKSLNFIRTKINKSKLTILSQQAGICIRALNLDFFFWKNKRSESFKVAPSVFYDKSRSPNWENLA